MNEITKFAYIKNAEREACIKGFFANMDGREHINPYSLSSHDYLHIAWDNGWRSFGNRRLPWEIESTFDYDERPIVHTFEETGIFKPEWRKPFETTIR